MSGGTLGLAYTLMDYRHRNFIVKIRHHLIAQSILKGDALTLKTKYPGAKDWEGMELIGKSYVIAIY